LGFFSRFLRASTAAAAFAGVQHVSTQGGGGGGFISELRKEGDESDGSAVAVAAESAAAGSTAMDTTEPLLPTTTEEAATFPDMPPNTSILPKPQNWGDMGKIQRRGWYKSAGQHINTGLERHQEEKWQWQRALPNRPCQIPKSNT
jgi:hypothetical protein